MLGIITCEYVGFYSDVYRMSVLLGCDFCPWVFLYWCFEMVQWSCISRKKHPLEIKLLHCDGMVGMKYPVILYNFLRRMDASNVTLCFIKGHLKEGQSVSLLYDSMLWCIKV